MQTGTFNLTRKVPPLSVIQCGNLEIQIQQTLSLNLFSLFSFGKILFDGFENALALN